jgi:hypothetical protein
VTNPPGVDASSRQEAKATDPLATTEVGYVYLFRSST